MPSGDVKPLVLASTVVAVALACAGLLLAHTVGADQIGISDWSEGSSWTSFDERPDAPGDYRCAGLAISYHTAGASHSPYPIWAGQWLFVDEAGQFRVGTCTFNRGVHSTIREASHPVSQSFPNDPTGAKSAYLTWKYGDTHDNLTAAAMWAVLHFYAQDAAGSNRAQHGNSPLVPALYGLAASSGNPELQQKALDLDDEAARFGGPWKLSMTIAADGVATLTLRSGATPVAGQQISVLVIGRNLPLAATTSADGVATVTVPLSAGAVTVVATVATPGYALAFRGPAVSLSFFGAQTMVTGGAPTAAQAFARLEGAPTTTTEPTTAATSTTIASTTPIVSTTVPLPPIEAAVTTVVPGTTVVPTAPSTTTPSTTAASTTTTSSAVLTPPATASTPNPWLPRTGGGDGGAAYLATALLVGGIGLLGTLRRRGQVTYTREGDAG